jgi:NADPH:quinone reductase
LWNWRDVRAFPALAIVRSAAAQEELGRLGVSHVLVASDPAFETQFAALAGRLKATAMFDGGGGALVTRILPLLPINSTLYSYGFMAGPEPVSFPTVLLITKNIVMKGFSNFASATVQNPERLSAALTMLSGMIDHPAFKTRIRQIFPLDQIGAAMKAETEAKSILVP